MNIDDIAFDGAGILADAAEQSSGIRVQPPEAAGGETVIEGGEQSQFKSEVTEAVKERDRLLLQVELAEERLKQITQLKLGRQIQLTKVQKRGSTEENLAGKQEPTDIYDTVIRLQKFQEKDIKIAKQEIDKVNKKVRLSKERIKSLQKEIEDLSEEIESMQQQHALRAKQEEINRERRMQEILAVKRYSEALKLKKQNVIDLEKSLEQLSHRTYPVLPDKPTTSTSK